MQSEHSRVAYEDKNVKPVIGKLEEDEDIDEKCSRWIDNCSITSSEHSALTDVTDNSALDCGYVFSNNKVLIGNQVVNNQSDVNVKLVVNKDKQVGDNIVINNSKKVIVGDVFIINSVDSRQAQNSFLDDKPLDFTLVVPRTNWLAQPPVSPRDYLDGPAKFVIISHTCTEEGFSEARNVLLLRLMQTFHIESMTWNDIAYNFLVGSDGLIYEGRGWGVIGSHTRHYNSFSVGISFIGCFLDHLPPRRSLLKTKTLIKVGVEMGYIAADYQLLAHCQCSAVESPGKALFNEIKTWQHWNDSVGVTNPAPEVL